MATFYLNLAQPWTIERSTDDTHTLITPCCGGDPSEALQVVETPEEIAALVEAARVSTMRVVELQCKETVEEILQLIA